jgi:translocator protein
MNTYEWYATLVKPTWAPPSWLFGPVWSVLYAIIFITFGYVFYKVFRGEWPLVLALPFVLNIITNLAFTPLQFGLQNNLLASIDILLILLTLIIALFMVYPYAPIIVYANLPYLAWVGFATVLQLHITYLNW